MRQESPDEGLSARLNLGLTARSGNVDATSLEFGGRAEYRRGLRTVFLAFLGDYAWQGGEQFSDQGLAHLRYVHGLTPRFALEAFLQGDYNDARLLDARAVAGAGVRVEVIAAESAAVSLGTSYMFEHEEVDVPPGDDHPRETDVSRWSNYAGVRWGIGDNAAMSVTGYVQPQLDDFEDVRVIAQGALDAKVAGPLSLALTYRLRHDSAPPRGVESTDSRLGTTLTVSF